MTDSRIVNSNKNRNSTAVGTDQYTVAVEIPVETGDTIRGADEMPTEMLLMIGKNVGGDYRDNHREKLHAWMNTGTNEGTTMTEMSRDEPEYSTRNAYISIDTTTGDIQ